MEGGGEAPGDDSRGRNHRTGKKRGGMFYQERTKTIRATRDASKHRSDPKLVAVEGKSHQGRKEKGSGSGRGRGRRRGGGESHARREGGMNGLVFVGGAGWFRFKHPPSLLSCQF